MKRANTTQAGFTLIELMLAMAFLGSILVLATLLLTQTLNIYNKGIAVKQMNQAGRTLVEDLTRAANSGRTMQVVGDGTTPHCLSVGNESYIWNIAAVQGETNTDGYKSVFYKQGGLAGTPVNFAKVEGGCPSDKNRVEGNASQFTVSPIVSENVRLYDVIISSMSTLNSNGDGSVVDTDLVRVSFLFGTYSGINSPYNLKTTGSGSTLNYECNGDALGTFCAKAQIETVLAMPRGLNL